MGVGLGLGGTSFSLFLLVDPEAEVEEERLCGRCLLTSPFKIATPTPLSGILEDEEGRRIKSEDGER